jgi:hypothetical protein
VEWIFEERTPFRMGYVGQVRATYAILKWSWKSLAEKKRRKLESDPGNEAVDHDPPTNTMEEDESKQATEAAAETEEARRKVVDAEPLHTEGLLCDADEARGS